MASGISVLYRGKETDLDDILEQERDTQDINTFDGSLIQTDPSSGLTPVTKYFNSISYGTEPCRIPTTEWILRPEGISLCKKGYRPKLFTTNSAHWKLSIPGSSTRRYYLAYRTETHLYIAVSTNADSYSTYATYAASSFPGGVVPYILYFEIVGGGGNGEGGWFLGRNGFGGGGGAVCYGWLPVRTVSSAPISSRSSEDLYFTIYKNNNHSSVYENGTAIIGAGGGSTGDADTAGQPGKVAVTSRGWKFYLGGINGGTGSGFYGSGASVSFNKTINLETLKWSASGGGGDGGGASRGRGGSFKGDAPTGTASSGSSAGAGGGGGGGKGGYKWGGGGAGAKGFLTFMY